MGRRLRLALCQIPNLFLRLEFSEFISFDDESVELFTDCAIKNPALIERRLRSLRADRARLRSISGCVSCSSWKEMALGTDQVLVKAAADPIPDVLYVGNPHGGPEITFSERILIPSCLACAGIDAGAYPVVARYLRRIQKYSAWKRRLLIEGYRIIGEEQARFLRDLNPRNYNSLRQADLAEHLGVHQTTVSRVFSNRLVEAQAVNGSRAIIPASNLFITRDEFLRIIVTPLLNNILRIEYATGRALSDESLALKAGIIARRTEAKYREESLIPGCWGRNRAYKAGTCERPYRFCSAKKHLDSAPNSHL
jgi:hypothetical protein